MIFFIKNPFRLVFSYLTLFASSFLSFRLNIGITLTRLQIRILLIFNTITQYEFQKLDVRLTLR